MGGWARKARDRPRAQCSKQVIDNCWQGAPNALLRRMRCRVALESGCRVGTMAALGNCSPDQSVRRPPTTPVDHDGESFDPPTAGVSALLCAWRGRGKATVGTPCISSHIGAMSNPGLAAGVWRSRKERSRCNTLGVVTDPPLAPLTPELFSMRMQRWSAHKLPQNLMLTAFMYSPSKSPRSSSSLRWHGARTPRQPASRRRS